MSNFKVTVIGGGTGSFTILSGLKNYQNLDLAAIVAMTDDGGSSGDLRDEFGALPPGDIRQCLVALSDSDRIWRQLFNFRYVNGHFQGQNFGNLFISTLEQITGDFEKALQLAAEILQVKGQVIPVTLDNVRLTAVSSDGSLIKGESQIDLKEHKIQSIKIEPEAEPNPAAVKRILDSDLLVICPGDLYTSILPNLAVKNIPAVIQDSQAVKVYVCNLMTQKNHTENFKVIDFVAELEKSLGFDIFDYVIYNTEKPEDNFLQAYASEDEYLVGYDQNVFFNRKTKFIGEKIISQKIPRKVKADRLKRALIRHDHLKIASILYNILQKKI